MERKYKISLEITSVIKESSLDCIKHTRDDPELNDKCIRFSDKLSGEIAYFPGISAKVLENIDIIQLKAKYLYFIKPNVYVISASNDEGNNLFIYYEYSHSSKEDNMIILAHIFAGNKTLLNYIHTIKSKKQFANTLE